MGETLVQKPPFFFQDRRRYRATKQGSGRTTGRNTIPFAVAHNPLDGSERLDRLFDEVFVEFKEGRAERCLQGRGE